MKPFKINRDSLHFRLATKYGHLSVSDFDSRYPECVPDFCNYVRAVLGGLFLCIGIILLLSILGMVFIVLPILNLIVYLQHEQLIDPDLIIVAVFVYSLLGGLAFWCNEDAIEKRRVKRYEKYQLEKDGVAPDPSFVQLCYKKFKEKTCFRIEVV